METIEMKKTITCLLVLCVMFSATAAVDITGGFGYGITIPTDGSALSVTGYDGNAGKGGGLFLNVTDDFYKLTFNGGFDYYAQTAVGYIYVDKALAAIDVELPVSLTLQTGNDYATALNVYANPNGNYAGRIRVDKVASLPIAATVDYEGLLTLKAGYSYQDTPAALADQTQNILLSAQITPIEGISATVSWTNHDEYSAYRGFTATKQAVTAVSAMVDLAQLVADLPVGISVSAAASIFDFAALGTSFAAIDFAVSMDDLSMDIEYEYNQGDTHGIGMNASYAGVDEVGLSAGVGSSDISDVAGNLWYYLKASYDLGGVSYYAKLSDAGIGLGMGLSF
jgi:hypothetical protein